MELLRGTEKFILWLITVGLVFLITIQMLAGTNGSKNYLHWARNRLDELVNPLEVQEVATIETDDFVTLRLVSSVNRPEVRVLVNNEKTYHFKNPVVQIPVRSDDLLIMDTRGIAEGLLFEVTATSDGVTKPVVGQRFLVQNDLKAFQVSVRDEAKF